jgi:hypothetical protein
MPVSPVHHGRYGKSQIITDTYGIHQKISDSGTDREGIEIIWGQHGKKLAVQHEVQHAQMLYREPKQMAVFSLSRSAMPVGPIARKCRNPRCSMQQVVPLNVESIYWVRILTVGK